MRKSEEAKEAGVAAAECESVGAEVMEVQGLQPKALEAIHCRS